LESRVIPAFPQSGDFVGEWNLYLKEDVQVAITKAVILYPHLEEMINQRLQALLDFPPKRWYRVHFRQGSAAFFPEPGQKIRLSGLVDFVARTVEVTRFSIHD
jgi:hypothetical protein